MRHCTRLVELIRQRLSHRTWLVIGVGVAVVLFISTLQTTINGSSSPYATDTGEIQNALPRWGTIHWTGYPQYTFIGSLTVTVLRPLGIAPAAGASLVSALWAALAAGLLIMLGRDLGVPAPTAVIGSWFLAVSTSFWMDASLAEVHTMTVALTIATIWFALRFGRTGQRSELLWLTFAFTQGLAHQRALVFVAPAVALLVIPRWRVIWEHSLAAVGVAAIAPLTYLYLPLRSWMGANWTFGQIGSVRGLWTMLTDNRADRIAQVPIGLAEWVERGQVVSSLLHDDLPWPLLAVGLGSLLLLVWRRSRREALGLTLAWLPYVWLSLFIWIGRVGDAILAAKLPVLPAACLGLGLALDWVWQRLAGLRAERGAKTGAAGLVLLGLAALAVAHYQEVVAVTRDPAAEEVIGLAEQVVPPPDDRPTILMALWGHDYWALAYAKEYQGRLPDLTVVDHNADFAGLLAQGHRLWTLSKTFYLRPVSWWEDRLGQRVFLSSVAPGIVQIATGPRTVPEAAWAGCSLDLENGLCVAHASLSGGSGDWLGVHVVWQAIRLAPADYSVAVHLVANEPPRGPEDVLAQADSLHPVDGWYPTSRWSLGEYVADYYAVQVPSGPRPAAVRVAMYRRREDGSFENSPWLSLPIE